MTAVIDQSMKDGKTRLDQLHSYEKLRDQVLEWLTRNENRVDSMEPVAVDAEILRKQTEELKVSDIMFIPYTGNGIINMYAFYSTADHERVSGLRGNYQSCSRFRNGIRVYVTPRYSQA